MQLLKKIFIFSQIDKAYSGCYQPLLNERNRRRRRVLVRPVSVKLLFFPVYAIVEIKIVVRRNHS